MNLPARFPRASRGAALAMAAVALLAFGPLATRAAGPARPCDFNGDGYTDLAIGVPHENDSEGAINVLYGSATGLTAAGDQLWTLDSPGVQGIGVPMPSRMGYGATITSGDFDGNGFADLATGIPGYPAGETPSVGMVSVLRGGPTGLTAAGDQLWTPARLGLTPDAYLFLGSSLRAVDLDRDAYSDLVIEAPGTTVGGIRSSTLVILFGSAAGLTTARQVDITVMDLRRPAQETGLTPLGATDVDGDGRVDLVIGAALGLFVVRWETSGPAFADLLLIGSTSIDPAVPDPIPLARAATGDFDADGYGDIVVGIPEHPETSGVPIEAAGAVVILYGSPTGPGGERRPLLTQRSPGVPGASEELDEFGAVLATGDLNRDGYDDLAVGAPSEDVGGERNAGAVTLLYGSPSGITTAGARAITQDTSGVPGASEYGDVFGWSLAIGNYGRGSARDLAIAAPWESFTGISRAGVVAVLYGSTGGLSTSGVQQWHQDTPGVIGAAEQRDYFGSTLPR